MGGIDDRDKVSIIGIWCWCFFLQSLPLKGLMKFLPNLLSICVGVTLKRMMNAAHCGLYSLKKVQCIDSLNARQKKISFKIYDWNWSSMPKGAAEICNIINTIFTVERAWNGQYVLQFFGSKMAPLCMQLPCKSVGRRPRGPTTA